MDAELVQSVGEGAAQLAIERPDGPLVEAMLEYGGRLAIAPDEWFTIAARDSFGPSYPGEPYDAMTLVLRIKGSDLADYRADRLTIDEARKRVEVREF